MSRECASYFKIRSMSARLQRHFFPSRRIVCMVPTLKTHSIICDTSSVFAFLVFALRLSKVLYRSFLDLWINCRATSNEKLNREPTFIQIQEVKKSKFRCDEYALAINNLVTKPGLQYRKFKPKLDSFIIHKM